MFARALIALSFLLAACSVGEVPLAGTPDAAVNNMNAQSFTTVMTPLVNPKCTGCHSSGTPPNLSSFAVLDMKYWTKPGMTNVMVTKGDHAGIIYFNATEKMTVQGWIDGLQ